MSQITQLNHFAGNIYLPNTTNQLSVEGAKATAFILKYEPEYLQYILGYELYDLFEDGLLANTTIYKNIRDGVTYTDVWTGRTEKWYGFATVGTNPIANYIYYQLLKNNAQQTTGIGQVNTVAENATRVSPEIPMCSAWNEMVDFNIKLYGFLYANQDIYPSWIGNDYYARSQEFVNLFRKINTFGI